MIEEAEQLRQALLEEAQQAQRAVRQAREQVDQIREEAREQGRTEAQREAAERLRPLVAGLEQALERFGRELPEQITRIALTCAGHIVRAELKADPERVCSIVRDVLERARFCRQVTIVVHPEHLALLEQTTTAQTPDGRIMLRADERCRPGDVRVETERGLIDASLHAQLARLEEALLADTAAQEQGQGPRNAE